MTDTVTVFTPPTTPEQHRLAQDAEALIGEARARQRQRRLRVLIAAVVLFAAAGGIYGGIGGGSGHVATVNSVERGLTDAISRAKTTLIMSQVQHATFDTVTLTDLATVTTLLRSSSRVGPDIGVVVAGITRSTSRGSPLPVLANHVIGVDYTNRSWSSRTFNNVLTPQLRAGLRPAALCQCEPFETALSNEIDRHVALLNDQTIDGQAAFHLRFTWALNQSSSAPGQRTRVDLWINTSTFLPIRETTSTTGQRTTTEDYSWLRRTPANLAKLRVVVPAGFTYQTSP
jgi:hypothetical protein